LLRSTQKIGKALGSYPSDDGFGTEVFRRERGGSRNLNSLCTAR
jgi:hypothetical protein